MSSLSPRSNCDAVVEMLKCPEDIIVFLLGYNVAGCIRCVEVARPFCNNSFSWEICFLKAFCWMGLLEIELKVEWPVEFSM